MSDQHVCQVAFSALNASSLRDWYHSAFGMVKAGMILSAPPMQTDRIQGISPNPVETISWLVDQQDYFQLEFFQFYRPRSKPRPLDWRPCDIGYNMVGIFAPDFDRVLAQIAAVSDQPLPATTGDIGDRRICVQDPEDNWVEMMERDPIAQINGADTSVVRPELQCATRFMRVSVPDLLKTRDSFVNAMGLSVVEDFQLHSPEHEALWGLADANAKSVLLRSRNFLVELVEYQSHDPRPRAADYQICDQGLMNIAIGYRDSDSFNMAFKKAQDNGMIPNGNPVDTGLFRVMYVNDPQGFSVEMLYARKPLWSISGFNPGQPYVENEIVIRASVERTWNEVVNHSGLGSWTPFQGKVLRPGTASSNGPGCIRELRSTGIRITEEIISWDQEKHYAYKLRTGAPFRSHRGDIFVSEVNGCTKVRWAIRFQSRIPFTGWVFALGLKYLFRNALKKLKYNLESE
ncbi:MAG: hypothetical protein HOC23_15205 [Halieaceae bacterium]|nr:hypothetical protein [Halieaceae bacterium]